MLSRNSDISPLHPLLLKVHKLLVQAIWLEGLEGDYIKDLKHLWERNSKLLARIVADQTAE
jgi:hypothetical protein